MVTRRYAYELWKTFDSPEFTNRPVNLAIPYTSNATSFL